MKTLSRLLVCLCLLACVVSVGAELSPVDFVVDTRQFKSGDLIVIDQVLATSPRLEVGSKVVVRGRYQLSSATKAKLGLFITHRSPTGADASSKSQIAPAESGSGTFEVSCDIGYEGDLHVSFYPSSGGSSFGGVYFSAAGRKSGR